MVIILPHSNFLAVLWPYVNRADGWQWHLVQVKPCWMR